MRNIPVYIFSVRRGLGFESDVFAKYLGISTRYAKLLEKGVKPSKIILQKVVFLATIIPILDSLACLIFGFVKLFKYPQTYHEQYVFPCCARYFGIMYNVNIIRMKIKDFVKKLREYDVELNVPNSLVREIFHKIYKIESEQIGQNTDEDSDGIYSPLGSNLDYEEDEIEF